MAFNEKFDEIDDWNNHKANIVQSSRIQDSFDDWNGGFIEVESKPKAEVLTEKGNSFVASQRAADVSNGTTVDYAIKTDSDTPTIVNFNVNVGGKVRVDFYENASVSNGTGVINENLNRADNASTSSDVQVLAGVTVDSQGDRIAVGGVGGSAKNVSSQGVPASLVGNPWILAPDTTYLYRIENVSGSEIDINPTLGYTTRSFE